MDTDHGSTPGSGVRNPNAALSAAVAQLNSALDVIAGIDPAAVAADEALNERETFCVPRGIR